MMEYETEAAEVIFQHSTVPAFLYFKTT